MHTVNLVVICLSVCMYVCMSFISQAENRWSYCNDISYECCAIVGHSKFLSLNVLQSVITQIHELVCWMRHYQSMVTIVIHFLSSLWRDFRRSLQNETAPKVRVVWLAAYLNTTKSCPTPLDGKGATNHKESSLFVNHSVLTHFRNITRIFITYVVLQTYQFLLHRLKSYKARWVC